MATTSTTGITNYNPYFDYLDSIFREGLDYVIGHAPSGAWTFNDLNKVTQEYVKEAFSLGSDPNPIIDNILPSIIPNTVNDFTNNKTPDAFARQRLTMFSMLNGLKTNSIDSYDSYFNLATEIIVKSKSSNADKAVMYIALAMTESSAKYWKDVVDTPGGWSSHLSSNQANNYANIPYWAGATFKGSVSGFAQIQSPNMFQANPINDLGRSFGLVGAVTAAVALTAGKVIFKWAQKPPYFQRQR